MARVLLLSPYHGGSHRAFSEGLARCSRHQVTLLTLPPRFWKWRMRGAAVVLAHRVRARREDFDVVLATDMLNLAEFRGLSGLADRPHLLYFHENQLSYPLPEHDRPDVHFGLTNVASALAADGVIFNSVTHRDAFFQALPGFLGAMPDCPLPDPLGRIQAMSRVIPVGCDLLSLRSEKPELAGDSEAPLILWNHRWEFDKAPEVFFRVLARLDEAGVPFRLALAGESSQVEPTPFLAARDRYHDRLVQFGWLPDRRDYGRLLRRSHLVVSTACQENFGVAVVEAIACGAWPLLPTRLSYPEVLPEAWHAECLYADEDDLYHRLRRLLAGDLPGPARREELARQMLRYDWTALIGTYDDLLQGVVARAAAGPAEVG